MAEPTPVESPSPAEAGRERALRELIATMKPQAGPGALAYVLESVPISSQRVELLEALQGVFDRRADWHGERQKDLWSLRRLARAARQAAALTRTALSAKGRQKEAAHQATDPYDALLGHQELMQRLGAAEVELPGRTETVAVAARTVDAKGL